MSQLAQRKVAPLRGNTQGNYRWADALGNVGLSLGTQQSGARDVDLDDSAAYLQFFTMAVNFGVFPHASRRPRAGALGAKSESVS